MLDATIKRVATVMKLVFVVMQLVEANVVVGSTQFERYLKPQTHLCTSMRWGPQWFNLTGKLVYVGNEGCDSKSFQKVTASIALIRRSSGCSAETIARNMQPWKPLALVFGEPMNTFEVPRISNFVSDGSSVFHISIPAASVTQSSFQALVETTASASHYNESSIIVMYPDENTFRTMFSSFWFLFFQIFFCGSSLFLYSWVLWKLSLWARTSSICILISLASTGIRALCENNS